MTSFCAITCSAILHIIQEKYDRELKDAAVRELMLAEEAAMLDKVDFYSTSVSFSFYVCLVFSFFLLVAVLVLLDLTLKNMNINLWWDKNLCLRKGLSVIEQLCQV